MQSMTRMLGTRTMRGFSKAGCNTLTNETSAALVRHEFIASQHRSRSITSIFAFNARKYHSSSFTTAKAMSRPRSPIKRALGEDGEREEPIGSRVEVKAYYIARKIDIMRIHSDLYNSCRQEFASKSLTITLDAERHKYISIFKFGSVVMYNLPEDQQYEHLRRIKDTATVVQSIDEGIYHTEEHTVIVHEELKSPSVIKSEHINLKNLGSNNVAIVSTIMAQTVALDYYAELVDKMLETFMEMNMTIEQTGNFNSLTDKSLHKLVAANNTIVANVLSQLDIFEETEAAWDYDDYFYTWKSLRKDFEIEMRYRDLSNRLTIMKDNSRFFLEVLHNQKSTKLEWIIVILIAGEMVVGICGLVMHYQQDQRERDRDARRDRDTE